MHARPAMTLPVTELTTEHLSQLPGPAIMGPPKQIACYSVTATGIEFNISSLRYFVTPPLGANLDEGCSSFMHRYKNVIHQPQRLDSVLLACLQSGAEESLLRADVVVRRGMLVKCVIGQQHMYFYYM